MNKLRGCAIVLGLAGAIIMTAADTKDVEATEKISYRREMLTAGKMTAEKTQACLRQMEEKQIKEKQRQAEEIQARQITTHKEESAAGYALSEEDYDVLLRIVEAEASGEDIRGRMLVANVVLNRVKSSVFPDTVKEVVYQSEGGRAQFSPVATGKIDRVSVSDMTKEAVELVLQGEDESKGALYFIAPAYADSRNKQWFEEHLTLLFSYHGHQFFA